MAQHPDIAFHIPVEIYGLPSPQTSSPCELGAQPGA